MREAVFEPLCRLKFELPCDEVSGAWLGARLHFREGSTPLGYIPGANWTKMLCDGVTRLVADAGVRVRTATDVVGVADGRRPRRPRVELASGERLEARLFVSALPTETYLRSCRATRRRSWPAIRFTRAHLGRVRDAAEDHARVLLDEPRHRGHTACGAVHAQLAQPDDRRAGRDAASTS